MKKINIFFCLLLIFTHSFQSTASFNESDSSASTKQQIDQKRLQQINFVIRSYFQNCQQDSQSKVLYNCSIQKQKYGQFLYGLFHKELILSFLKYYQLSGKLSTENQVAQMYKVGQKVHEMTVRAYNDWIQIYKPNDNITVEEMYGDISQLDMEVLDVIQHDMKTHEDFVNVLRKVYRLQTSSKKYIVMGYKSQEQIAKDYAGILQVYFGQCRPLSKCKIPLNRFVYFVKELSFYITPLVDQHQGKESILVSEDMDFRATEFLAREIEKMKPILGLEVDYEELQKYSQSLATELFSFLKGQEQKEGRIDNRTNQRKEGNVSGDQL